MLNAKQDAHQSDCRENDEAYGIQGFTLHFILFTILFVDNSESITFAPLLQVKIKLCTQL